jgi:hypothetical protein
MSLTPWIAANAAGRSSSAMRAPWRPPGWASSSDSPARCGAGPPRAASCLCPRAAPSRPAPTAAANAQRMHPSGPTLRPDAILIWELPKASRAHHAAGVGDDVVLLVHKVVGPGAPPACAAISPRCPEAPVNTESKRQAVLMAAKRTRQRVLIRRQFEDALDPGRAHADDVAAHRVHLCVPK